MQGFNASMIAAVYPDLLVRTNATVAEMSVALAFGSAGGLLSPIFAVITDKCVISQLWYITVQSHSNIHIKYYIDFSIILLAGASCHMYEGVSNKFRPLVVSVLYMYALVTLL